MGYVDSNLMNGEVVHYRAHVHWLRYFWAAFWAFIGVVNIGTNPGGVGLGFFLAFVLGILAFLDIQTSEFAVTNRRVFLKQGILRRQSVELLLTKIEGVQIDQGIFGRIFGYGTLVPGGTGGTKQGFRLIKDPLAFRQKINEQIEHRQGVAA